MLCQKCNKREANTLVKQNINGEVSQYYLCSPCATQMGFTAPFGNLKFDLDMGTFLGGILGAENLNDSDLKKLKVEPSKVCFLCGSSMHDILSSGKVGCPNCYTDFSRELNMMLKRIHGQTKHSGKVPVTASREVNHKRELSRLKSELVLSIAEQEFEKAAKLRDEIREIEKEMDNKSE